MEHKHMNRNEKNRSIENQIHIKLIRALSFWGPTTAAHIEEIFIIKYAKIVVFVIKSEKDFRQVLGTVLSWASFSTCLWP
jgi:hypothetical protein